MLASELKEKDHVEEEREPLLLDLDDDDDGDGDGGDRERRPRRPLVIHGKQKDFENFIHCYMLCLTLRERAHRSTARSKWSKKAASM